MSRLDNSCGPARLAPDRRMTRRTGNCGGGSSSAAQSPTSEDTHTPASPRPAAPSASPGRPVDPAAPHPPKLVRGSPRHAACFHPPPPSDPHRMGLEDKPYNRLRRRRPPPDSIYTPLDKISWGPRRSNPLDYPTKISSPSCQGEPR
jgi:hypothetical protein